jgi:hypothetical protein
MSVTAKIHGTPSTPPAGLSPSTQKLWLAAMRYRSLADALAADTQKAAQ